MSKKILTHAVQSLGFTNGLQSEQVVSAVIAALAKEIHHSKSFRLVGFGTFSVVKTKQREARNPRTGATVVVPAGSKVRFKASKELKKGTAKRTRLSSR